MLHLCTGDKASKVAAVASDGRFWVSKVLSTIDQLNQDAKHVSPLSEVDEEDKAFRKSARELTERMSKVCRVVIPCVFEVVLLTTAVGRSGEDR